MSWIIDKLTGNKSWQNIYHKSVKLIKRRLWCCECGQEFLNTVRDEKEFTWETHTCHECWAKKQYDN